MVRVVREHRLANEGVARLAQPPQQHVSIVRPARKQRRVLRVEGEAGEAVGELEDEVGLLRVQLPPEDRPRAQHARAHRPVVPVESAVRGGDDRAGRVPRDGGARLGRGAGEAAAVLERVEAAHRVVLLAPRHVVPVEGLGREIALELVLEQRRAPHQKGVELARALKAAAVERDRRLRRLRLHLKLPRPRLLRLLVRDLDRVGLDVALARVGRLPPGRLQVDRVAHRVAEVGSDHAHHRSAVGVERNVAMDRSGRRRAGSKVALGCASAKLNITYY
eukprot:3029169-Prymnesium_polylepis.1